MLGYVCKYTPVEIFTSMGIKMIKIEPDVTNFNQADALMHANVCSYAKAVLEEVSGYFSGQKPLPDGSEGELEGIIFTTCCDSIRRLYDTLKNLYPEKFFYIIDIPRKVNDFAGSLYGKRILALAKAYEAFHAAGSPDAAPVHTPAVLPADNQRTGSDFCDTGHHNADTGSRLNIGIMGARCSKEIRSLLEDADVNILFDMTCTGLERNFSIKDANNLPEEELLRQYAFQLLNQVPCMRMLKAADRATLLDGFTDRLDGILYHTVKFCDNYSFEYADFKETLSLPVLAVETDCTRGSSGQLKTRVEAFLEELSTARGISRNIIHKNKRTDGKMYILGIDSGSTSTNAVILNEKKELIAFDVVRTGAKTADSANRILNEILDHAGLTKEDLSLIVSTGYGRVSIPFADRNVTEISCHGKGAHYLNPDVRTILDIGGQDSKAIRLNESGEVVDFVMNDKCAAGTGRFLEAMARTLEIPIEKLGPISLTWKEDIDISSMCTVFAESEVISLIALNKEKSDIAHGIHKAIAGKAMTLLRKVGLEKTYMMTGGVAKNPGVVAVLEELLGDRLFISKEPEIVGALGAALYGWEELQ